MFFCVANWWIRSNLEYPTEIWGNDPCKIWNVIVFRIVVECKCTYKSNHREERWLHGRSGQAPSWIWTHRGGLWLQSEQSWCSLWRSAVWSAPWLKWTSDSQRSLWSRLRYLWNRVCQICKNISLGSFQNAKHLMNKTRSKFITLSMS